MTFLRAAEKLTVSGIMYYYYMYVLLQTEQWLASRGERVLGGATSIEWGRFPCSVLRLYGVLQR